MGVPEESAAEDVDEVEHIGGPHGVDDVDDLGDHNVDLGDHNDDDEDENGIGYIGGCGKVDKEHDEKDAGIEHVLHELGKLSLSEHEGMDPKVNKLHDACLHDKGDKGRVENAPPRDE